MHLTSKRNEKGTFFMFKKILSFLLVMLMIVTVTVSCGNDPEKPNSQTDSGLTDSDNEGTSDTIDDPLFAEIDEYIDELSATYNFKGKTFTNFGIGWQAPEKEEETGNVMSDAFYFRQRAIEEAFGLVWKNARAVNVDPNLSATVEDIKQDVLAGVGAYDASYGNGMHCQNLLVQDALYDLSSFEVLDFERDWWPEGLEETYGFMGALYFLNGPIISSFYQDGCCVLFNKQVAEDYGLTDVYSIVKDGDWTWDKMFEVAACVPQNENGSGAYRYANPNGPGTIMSHDVPLTLFDEDGLPYYAESVPVEIFNIADKFSKIFSDNAQTVNTLGEASGHGEEDFEDKYGYEGVNEMFEAGEILFMFTTTENAAELRTLDVKFGILPFPKGSETQENYVSPAHYNGFRNVFVPKSIKDPQKTDVVLEAMAALGYKYFKPVYYDTILKGRTVHDYESKDMVDIIFNTKRFDLLPIVDKGANMNSYGELTNIFRYSVEETSDTLTSRYFLKSKIVNSNIQMILKNIQAENEN